MSLNKNKSAKKRQKAIRNILVLPDKCAWPEILESEAQALSEQLQSCLKPVKINVPRSPLYILRPLSKEARVKKQEEILKSLPSQQLKAYQKALELRKFLFIGVNSLCKGIEDGKVASCIFDANASPKILVSHLVDLSRNIYTPILAIPNLKETLKQVLGFSSLALGFKKSVMEDRTNIFHEICLNIIQLAKSLKSFKKFINKDLIQVSNEQEMNKPCDKSETKMNTEEDDKIIVENSVDTNKTSFEQTLNNPTNFLLNIYLYRQTENVRVFKPGYSNNLIESVSEVLHDKQEISLGNIKLSKDKIVGNKILDRRYFNPLKVNRIQSNPIKKKFKK